MELLCTRPDDITPLDIPCDVLCPAATGGVLNPVTIPLIQAPIICGAANNQLEDPQRDSDLLAEHGILYMPDFLVNRMGIVNCANEQYGYIEGDSAFARHLDYTWEYSVYQTSLQVIERAAREGVSTHQAAVQSAEELSQVVHPIWGHRGQEIIESLSDPKSSEDAWVNSSSAEQGD